MLRGISLQLGTKTAFHHHSNIPPNLRALIIGSSGSGKSTLLLQMLIEPGYLDYDNLLIVTQTKDQPIYQFIRCGFESGLTKEILTAILLKQAELQYSSIPDICARVAESLPRNGSPISIKIVDKLDQIPHPDDLTKSKKHLVVFDDVITLRNQGAIESYFVFGRHNNVSVIYLSQSYFDLPRIIRLNANYLILFKLSQRNLTDVYANAVANFMDDRKKFNQLALHAWSNRYGYIAIDKENNNIRKDIFDNDEPANSLAKENE